jgi:adenosylmethionine-8-amino-7-oxononanoate aminotransferase
MEPKDNSALWRKWDHAYLWHPFTQMCEWLAEDPLVIERAEGNYLFDSDGKKYFDGVSSLWCNVHGHGRPEITSAIQRQAAQLAHSTLLGLTHPPAAELAKHLIEIAPPGLQRVFFSDSGATAVEIALKMAYAYWQLRGEHGRDLFVSLTEAYHGDTVGAMSVGYSELFDAPYRDLLFPCLKINPPHWYRYYKRENHDKALQLALEEGERVLTRDGKRIAALIVEPMMQGAAGMWIQAPEYLAGLRRICTENRILLIADEVAVGFGRTGRMFACEHAGVSPDLMCLGKGITGGMLPLAATLATEEIFNAFLGNYEERKAFFHGHTYTGNPIACAAALASLELFQTDGTLEHVAMLAKALEAGGARLSKLAHVSDVRQCGLMMGIELAEDADLRRPFPTARRFGRQVITEARRQGAILRPLGDVIVLMPPLSTSEAELQNLISIVAESIAKAANDVAVPA